MEIYILIFTIIGIAIIVSIFLGLYIEKKNNIEKQLKIGEKIDKIIANNNNINKHEWVDWLQNKRNKQK